MIRALMTAAVVLVTALPAHAAVKIQEITSPGGIRAWLVEEHSLPFTALELRFEGGASLDAPGKRGATTLMTSTLEEGAGDLDSQGFAAAREALAADISFDAGDDAVSVSVQMLTENRDQVAALLKSALTEPRFDQDAIDRVRAQIDSLIRQDETDPGRISSRTLDHLAFGDHPYGTVRNGTLESLAALTRDDLIAAKDAVLARDRVSVAAVGDITPEVLGKLIDEVLGPLPATGAPMPPHVTPDLTGGVTVVDFDSPQSVVNFGQPGIKRDDPDFFAAYVLNHIIGGQGFSARLMDEVREKRGLTYGIGTFLMPLNLAETWQGTFSSANEKVAEAIGVVQDVWADVAANGVTEAELDAAKTYLTGSFPLRFDGNDRIAGILVGMMAEGLPVTYVNDRNGYIEAVTLDDVKRVARRLMTPGGLRFVVVGKPVGLQTTN